MSESHLPADYHTHTPLCLHASGEPEDYIDRALASGVAEYGVSDHAPQGPEPFDDWRMREAQLPDYYTWIDRARERAGDRLAVRAGLECEWIPANESWIEKLAGQYDWDYLIGSVHYLVPGNELWNFDNPVWLERWAKTDVDRAWELYWKEYTAMAQSGLFDILAHPDLIKKFGYYPSGDLASYYMPVIESVAENGVAIELNMAGLGKPCKEAYPSMEFLKLAAQAGIPITLSSDAHAPGEVAQYFDVGVKLLKEAGFEETCLFENRKRAARPIE